MWLEDWNSEPARLLGSMWIEDWVQSHGQWLTQLYLHNWTPIKTLNFEAQGASWLGNTLIYWEGNVPWFHRERYGNCIWDPPWPSPRSLFMWLVWICILYNKTVILCIMLSQVLWVVLTNYQTQENHLIPKMCSQSFKSADGLGTSEVWLASEVRTVLWRTEPSTCGIYANCRWLLPELNCSKYIGDEIEYVHQQWVNTTSTQNSRLDVRSEACLRDWSFKFFQVTACGFLATPHIMVEADGLVL